jgi:hypothetical protein
MSGFGDVEIWGCGDLARNCQYGFARTLWAMKSIGITISVVSLASLGALTARNFDE